MPDTGSHTVLDPRKTDGSTLDIEFEIESYGSSGNNFDDDGDPAEFSLTLARDITGANVLDLLSDDDQDKICETIHFEYDWSYSDPYEGYEPDL